MADPPSDDDTPDPAEWFAAPTEVDGPALPPPARDRVREPITAPHPIAGDVAAAFEAGRRQGFADGFRAGQDDALGALSETMLEHFGNDPVIRHTVARIRSKLTPI